MISGIFHQGSGLGDQLFRYITVRTLAEKKGTYWEMLHENYNGSFKGESFLDIDYNNAWKNRKAFSVMPILRETSFFNEKDVRDSQGNDIRSYDPEINFVEDNTIIDGSFEDDKYWRHNLNNISNWLAVKLLSVSNDLCVIGFRGGEYATQPDLFLPKTYFTQAIITMTEKYNIKSFELHTDDPLLANQYLESHVLNGELDIIPNQAISHSKHTNMGLNWRSMRYAKYAIIPNSAFFILPRLLKHHEDPSAVTIAPRYWARRNTKTWARPACYYPEFQYI